MVAHKSKQQSLMVAAGVGVGAIGGALAAYGFLIEPRWLELTHTRIQIQGLHPDLVGLRIALLTDMHGERAGLNLLKRACRMAMAQQPDLIALSGDFVEADPDAYRPILDVLNTLDARLGIYAVPGNHDHKASIRQWHRALAEYPRIEDMTNRALIKKVKGARLCIAGVDDFDRGNPRLEQLPRPEVADYTILVAHNPDQAEHIGSVYDRIDLVLSGHKHGGQVRVPWIGALRNPAHHDNIYEYGLHHRPWAQVYVSRGIGMVHLSVRFLCRPEVAILDLARAD